METSHGYIVKVSLYSDTNCAHSAPMECLCLNIADLHQMSICKKGRMSVIKYNYFRFIKSANFSLGFLQETSARTTVRLRLHQLVSSFARPVSELKFCVAKRHKKYASSQDWSRQASLYIFQSRVVIYSNTFGKSFIEFLIQQHQNENTLCKLYSQDTLIVSFLFYHQSAF